MTSPQVPDCPLQALRICEIDLNRTNWLMASIYSAHHCCQCLSSRPTTREQSDRVRVERSRQRLHDHTDSGNFYPDSVPDRCARKCSARGLGENASDRHGTGHTVGISRLRPQSLPLLRSPLEMTGTMSESSILTPLLIANC